MNDFNKQVLSDMISAYRKGYSCQSSLFKLCEEMSHAKDHSDTAVMILMDLSKAFHCLPNDLMVANLTAYGMSPSAIKLLINYLRIRHQHVKIGWEFSDWMTILKGVPQGFILGPCLFNLFLNDFMYILENSSPVNYADDNTLIYIDFVTLIKRNDETPRSSALKIEDNTLVVEDKLTIQNDNKKH